MSRRKPQHDLHLVFGNTEHAVSFGPLLPRYAPRNARGIVEYDFIEADITVLASDGEKHFQSGEARNGIEPLALTLLRDDLRTLIARGGGRIFFGDHDFGEIVDLQVLSSGNVWLLANVASADVWDIDVTDKITLDDLDQVIQQIDDIEDRFGPLTGHCGCGAPSSSYYSG